MATNLIISTEFGDLTLALNYEKALHTAGYFAEETLKGTFDGGSIFRIVTEANAAMRQHSKICLLYTSPSPRDATLSRMPSSA